MGDRTLRSATAAGHDIEQPPVTTLNKRVSFLGSRH